MKFGTFVFPISKNPCDDNRIIDETLEEVVLCDKLGFHTAWLSEHHFDGSTAYVDPVVFAAAITSKTSEIRVGFAVVEMALHHPVRLAAQVSLLDNLSNGRVTLGTGKGSAFNEYEYIGFGVSMADAGDRLSEAESLILEAWKGHSVDFKGKFWNVSFPSLRPMPFQKPHPPLVRACLSLESTREMARIQRPILIAAQDINSIKDRMEAYREELEYSKVSDTDTDQLLKQIWVSKNVFVSESSSHALEIARNSLEVEQSHFRKARDDFNPGNAKNSPSNANEFESTFIAGTPEQVVDQILELKKIGVHNLMMKMNTGEMDSATVRKSINLFAERVMPHFTESH